MDKKVFYERFVSSLDKIKEEEELDNRHDALLFWAGVNYFLLDKEDVKEGMFQDRFAEGIDSVFINRDEHIINFVSAKTVESYENTSRVFAVNWGLRK